MSSSLQHELPINVLFSKTLTIGARHVAGRKQTLVRESEPAQGEHETEHCQCFLSFGYCPFLPPLIVGHISIRRCCLLRGLHTHYVVALSVRTPHPCR